MEGKSFRPTNLNDIPKFKSDTSKWVYFFANLTEEVWVPLKEVFEADYRRHLRFQMINDGLVGAEETKVHFVYTFICALVLEHHFFLLCVKQTDATPLTASVDESKVAAKNKPRSSRQNLNQSVFTNMQHIHPSLQIFILKHIVNFYTSKKELLDDISFYHCMSVSFFFPLLFFSHFKHPN